METRKRYPIEAVLLSIFFPGLGQIYNGQIKKGIIFIFIIFLVPIPIYLTGIQFHFYGLLFFLVLGIFVWFYIIGDAFYVAKKKKEIVLRSYNRWYYYILFAVLMIGFSVITEISFVNTSPLGSRIKAYRVPSGSLMPTLLIGDRIFVNVEHFKTNEIKRGDMIVFRYPENPQKDFLKRVIAIGGDEIESRDKIIYINGSKINEPYIQHTDESILSHEIGPRDNFGPIEVPRDKFFVMGDNRDQSHDSRFWGVVDISDIKGKALYTYWSWDPEGSARWDRIGKNIE